MILCTSTLLAALLAVPPLPPSAAPAIATASAEVAPEDARPIDLAICLDTSGSMSGLIDAARQKLWEIVNDLALAEPTPELRVALLTYGNNGHDPESGWVLVETDLTTDLDLVSERLFALRTNGGEEYVGRVVSAATKSLAWHPSSEALRIVIVAGNESADQDRAVSFRDACRDAIARDVMVNAIYCGNPADEIAPGWREVAQLADGKFASIDQNEGTIVVATPFDDDLARLSTAVNGTFFAYTTEGQRGQQAQWAQDENAASLNSAAVAARAVTKGCDAIYQCSWDLIDASAAEDFDLAAVEEDALPEAIRGKTLEEKAAWIADRAAERKRLQDEITALGAKRTQWITEELTRRGQAESAAFDFAVRQAIREQAVSRGFVFPAPPAPVAEGPEQPVEGEDATNEDDC